MSNLGTILKRLLQAAAAAFYAPPESVVVADKYGNEWAYVQERTCYCVNKDEQDVCSNCGEPWEYVQMFCPNCGAKVVEQ